MPHDKDEEEFADDNVPLAELVQLLAVVRSKVHIKSDMSAEDFIYVDLDTDV